MITTILVPLDGSPLSERALPLAEALTRAQSGKLVLTRAALAQALPGTDPTEQQVQAVEEAEAYLQRVAAVVAQRGLTVETAVPYGRAAEAILVEVAIRQADLIVMATHGRSGLGRWLYGSVADHVLREAEVPVLLVPAVQGRTPAPAQREVWPGERPPRVLVPLDGSTRAEEALSAVNQLGPNVELYLLRVIGPINYALYGEAAGYVYAEPEEDLAAARSYLEDLAGPLRAQGRPVRVEAVEGYPAGTIARVAREQQVDLIAMATHGRGGLARFVLGSVATGALQQAEVPLLLIRPTAVREAVEPAPAAPTPEPEVALPPEPLAPRMSLDLTLPELALIERGLDELLYAPAADRNLARSARELRARLRQAEPAPTPDTAERD